MPLLAIEILSPAQGIQELADKAKTLPAAGVSTVWIVDTYTRTVIVVNNEKKETFHREPADSEGIKVDFRIN
ncbi:MAG: Uma2 family endonuclease [Desulfococcaceae bacterium]